MTKTENSICHDTPYTYDKNRIPFVTSLLITMTKTKNFICHHTPLRSYGVNISMNSSDNYHLSQCIILIILFKPNLVLRF